MLTKNDLKKLKEIFVTKEEFQQSLKKALEKNTDIIVKEIRVVIDILAENIDKLNNNIKETRGHRVAIGDHEERIQKVEHKYSS